MQIIFQGSQTSEEAADSMLSILKLFKDKYGIHNFRELHLNVTLLDEQGNDVELIDATTSEIYGVFEVYKSTVLAQEPVSRKAPRLKLIVDNTKE